LAREIEKYTVKPNIMDRLEHVSWSTESSTLNMSVDEQVKEVRDLIDILISDR